MPVTLTLAAFDGTVYPAAEALAGHLFANQFLLACGLAGEPGEPPGGYVSRHAAALLGYASGAVDAELLHAAIHPDDRPFVLRAAQLAAAFGERARPWPPGGHPLATGPPVPPPPVSFSVDYRLRRQSGGFVRVMRQDFVLAQSPAGRPLATGSVFTDISDHKTGPDVRLSVHHPDFIGWLHARPGARTGDALSLREQEIAGRMLVGESSEAIAAALFISALTLKTHRRNINRKLKDEGGARRDAALA